MHSLPLLPPRCWTHTQVPDANKAADSEDGLASRKEVGAGLGREDREANLGVGEVENGVGGNRDLGADIEPLGDESTEQSVLVQEFSHRPDVDGLLDLGKLDEKEEEVEEDAKDRQRQVDILVAGRSESARPSIFGRAP